MGLDASISFDASAWDASVKRLSDVWNDTSFNTKQRQQMKAILEIGVFKDVVQHFADQSGPSGEWKGWSDSYRKHMERIGKGGNLILQDSGRLRQANFPGSGSSGSRATGDGLLFFNNAQTSGGFPYAYAHDTGGPKLPQRKFMWVSPGAMSSIADQVANWLKSVWEAE
jgi:phage gpG-like protein